MNKYQLLRLRATEFRTILQKYAKKDKDVDWFLKQWMPWHDKITQHKIRLPCYEYNMSVYFFSMTDISPNFFERYVAHNDYQLGLTSKNHPLANAARNFEDAIRDMYSNPDYLARLKKTGGLPDLVPDEQPPQEEETKLSPELLFAGTKRTTWQFIKEYVADFFMAIKEAKKIWLN